MLQLNYRRRFNFRPVENWKRVILVANDTKPVKALAKEIYDRATQMKVREQVLVDTYGVSSIFSVSSCNERFIAYLKTHQGCKILYTLPLSFRPA